MEIQNLFLNLDYSIDNFQYKNISQNYQHLKSNCTDYDLTGQIVWNSAKFLSQFIIDNQEIFQNKIVLEVGSGTGLSGLVCSQFSKKVYLTDGNEIILDLLKKQVQQSINNNCLTYHLQWGKKETNNFFEQISIEKIDIIIGSDILFWPDSIEPLVQTLISFIQFNALLKIFLCIEKRCNQNEDKFDFFLKENNLERRILQQYSNNIFLYQIKQSK